MPPYLQLSRRAFRSLYGLTAPDLADQGSGDFDRLLEWARQHRVLGLFETDELARIGAPDQLIQAWRTAILGQVRYTAFCAAEAERIFACLQSVGLDVILIKGPALAAQAWPAQGLRTFDDLDFRAPRSAYADLVLALRDLGYKPEIESDSQRAHAWHFGWGIGFIGPNRLRVEVNHRMFPPQFPWPRMLKFDDPDVTATLILDRMALRTLSPPMHLLLSSLHAVWHGWERLAWVVDIAGLLARHPEALPQVYPWVSRAGFPRRALLAGASVAEDLFGPGLTTVHLPHEPAPVIEDARRHLTRATPGLTMAQQRHCHNRLMSEREKWRYHFLRLATPGEKDFRWIELPASLRNFYWAMRPLRGLATVIK